MKATPKLPQQNRSLRAYEKLVDGRPVSAIRYIQGQPRNIRFNGQSGRFSIDGREDLGTTLEIVPCAWRVFEGEIFNRPRAEYAELFYVDSGRNMCCLLLINASVWNLKRFMAQVHYGEGSHERNTLSGCKIRITSAARQNRSNQGRYHVAEFEFLENADERARWAFFQFCQDHKVYRTDTRPVGVTDTLFSVTYFTMIGAGVRRDQPDHSEAVQIQRQYI